MGLKLLIREVCPDLQLIAELCSAHIDWYRSLSLCILHLEPGLRTQIVSLLITAKLCDSPAWGTVSTLGELLHSENEASVLATEKLASTPFPIGNITSTPSKSRRS